MKQPTAFRDLFHDAALAALAGVGATLSDAKHRIACSDLPAYFTAVEQHLQGEGVQPGDCVALECHNTVNALILMFTLLRRGQHLLLLPARGDPLKEPGFTPSVPDFCRHLLTISATRGEPHEIVGGIQRYPHPGFDAHALHRIADQAPPLLLLRTSGSMGDAKIVRFTHANLLGNAGNCVERFELTREARVAITVPVFHMYGLGAALLPALMAGASIDLLENTNILRFLDQERRFDPDTLYLNPTIAAMLLKGRRGDRVYARSISAGAAFPDALYQEYRRRFGRLFNLYGSTELGAAATTLPELSDDRPNRLTALPGVTFRIDPDTSGLHCDHPWPFDGYSDGRGNPIPVVTRPYDTGDVARSLGHHRIELLGRRGDSTNRSGFLVLFSDIENALLHTGLVSEAVVLSDREETIRGDKLIALCVPKPGLSTSVEAIREACFAHLPRYAIPDEIRLRDRFPITASGKIDRNLLQRQLHESTTP